MVDVRGGGKKDINVWEVSSVAYGTGISQAECVVPQSASILLYLSKTYDKKCNFHFEDDDDETEMMNWIMFMCVP